MVAGDGVSWSVGQTGNATIRVTQRDPGAGNRIVAEGTIDTGLPSAGNLSVVPIGRDVFVVLGSSSYDRTTQKSKYVSKVFKVTAI